jgi:hypothetical protein
MAMLVLATMRQANLAMKALISDSCFGGKNRHPITNRSMKGFISDYCFGGLKLPPNNNEGCLIEDDKLTFAS